MTKGQRNRLLRVLARLGSHKLGEAAAAAAHADKFARDLGGWDIVLASAETKNARLLYDAEMVWDRLSDWERTFLAGVGNTIRGGSAITLKQRATLALIAAKAGRVAA